MKPVIAFLSVCIVLFSCNGLSNTSRVTSSPNAEKLTLSLTPVSSPATEVEWTHFGNFTALRYEFARREDFSERCEVERPGKDFMSLIDASKPDAAARVAVTWLKRCPVAAQVHLWAAGAYREVGDEARAESHIRWFEGLTDSAMESGDGKTPETAYEVISVTEEYAVLTRLGLEPVRQSLLAGNAPVDAIEAKDRQERETTVYFNPKWHFVRLRHALGKASQ